MLELFTDAAKLVTERFGGDKDQALKACLAFISGRYQNLIIGRSLLSGTEKMTTLELNFITPVKQQPIEAAWSYIRSCVPPKNTEQLRVLRVKRDGSGVVFDVWEDKCERFLYGPEYLRERDGHVSFDIMKCTVLPDLLEEDDYEGGGGSGWRSGYDGGGYGRGGYGGSSRGRGGNEGGGY